MNDFDFKDFLLRNGFKYPNTKDWVMYRDNIACIFIENRVKIRNNLFKRTYRKAKDRRTVYHEEVPKNLQHAIALCQLLKIIE